MRPRLNGRALRTVPQAAAETARPQMRATFRTRDMGVSLSFGRLLGGRGSGDGGRTPGRSGCGRRLGKRVHGPDELRQGRRDAQAGVPYLHLHLRAAVGDRLKDKLTKSYDNTTVPRPYSPDAASAGKRSLRIVCIDLLAATSDEVVYEGVAINQPLKFCLPGVLSAAAVAVVVMV